MENMEELKANSQPSVDAQENKNIEGQVSIDFGSSEKNSHQDDDTSSLLLGKFKDVEALKNAYLALQSDYTKKCQLLSEKEKSNSTSDGNKMEDDTKEKVSVSSLSKEEKDNILQEYIFSNPELKDKFLAKYFDELSMPSSPKLISSDRGSGFVTAPKNKPRNLKEAGKLAEEVLTSKN